MIPNLLSDLAAGAAVQNWLVLGPFIVRTPGHFEREYLYERDRILEIDYLAQDGGEAAVTHELGRTHANIGLGAKQLAWREYPEARLYGMRIAGDLIYETVQRNCVVYAAAGIDAHHDTPALLDAYHSGMKAWINGELVCNEPYGLPKGVRTTMPSKLVQLRSGRNLLLMKFRPGHIADGIDFCVRDVRVSPLAAERGLPIALGRFRPLEVFTGTVDMPRQIIEAALVNTSHVALRANVSVASETLHSEDAKDVDLEPGRITRVRLSLLTQPESTGETVRAVIKARVYGREIQAPLEYQAAQPPKYDGTSFVLTPFHFDTTYHEEQRVYAMGAFDIVRQYCRLHRADPTFRSILSEIDYLKPYFDVFPEDRETLLKVFREKHSEPDVMYNQPNEQTCCGEALVRNFLYGQLFHGRVLGNICHVYGPGDVFGHPNQLSQIARKSGCIGVSWDKHIYNFPPLFQHLALDGGALPHKRGPASWDDVHEMGLSVTTGEIDQTPRTDWHATLMPKVRQGTYLDLMSAIHREVEETGAHLPVTSRDMSLYHAATSMSRVELKIANRLGENVLIAAEKFATIAALLGARYPDKALDKAWRQLLCGQHHDSITGTHNEISYVDLMNAYREVLELGTGALDDALDHLGSAIAPGESSNGAKPLVVFNSLAWERTDVVRATVRPGGAASFTIRDHRGKDVPFEVAGTTRNAKGGIVQAEVVFVAKKLPSLGYRAYQVAPSTKKTLPARKRGSGAIIENEFYRIQVDEGRGGGIVSLYDKEARREVLKTTNGHPGNELAILHEVPDRKETQHEFYTTGLRMFSGEAPASVEVEEGPVSSTVRARYTMGELCGVVQEITLVRGVKRIEFSTVLLDYQGEDHLFCVTFPANLRGAVPVFDERFGVVVRNDSKGYLDFRTHRQVMFSDCAVYAANKWMEYGSSALVQAGRSRYALGMAALVTARSKSDVAVAESIQRTLIKKGVTCTPWFDQAGPHWGSYLGHMDADLLYTRFRISIGSRGKNAYSKKLLEAEGGKVRAEFKRRLKRDGYACLLVKDADLTDHKGDPWPPLPVLIVEANDPKALAAAWDTLLADFPKTATIRLPEEANATGESHTVDDYGIALLNEGAYANSIEKGGVICVVLAHTCRWYGGTNNFPEGYLVPEKRNHVYRYALYPHAGTWRDADTQQAAHAFNFPLLARETKPAGRPPLPTEESFIKVSPKNVILAAMKPWGNPIAAFEPNGVSDPAAGVMLRLYDTEGVDSTARIRFASGIKAAWCGDLLEQRQAELPVANDAIELHVPAFSLETVGFVPGPLGRKMGARILGAQAEPVQPVWVRSWEHDAESMPMGYAAVVCTLSREVKEENDGRVLRLRVNMVNDYTDSPASGVVHLVVPEEWTVEPAAIAFELPPLGHRIAQVVVTRPAPDAAGQVKLRHEFDGQVFQDVLEIGQPFELEMTAQNVGAAIHVKLTNPTAETIEGEVALVSPVETWSRHLAGPYALLDIEPRTQAVSLGPGDSVTVTYTVTPVAHYGLVNTDSYWAVVKLMSNGRIRLVRCDNRPPRRLWDDHCWHAMLRAKAPARFRRKRG